MGVEVDGSSDGGETVAVGELGEDSDWRRGEGRRKEASFELLNFG